MPRVTTSQIRPSMCNCIFETQDTYDDAGVLTERVASRVIRACHMHRPVALPDYYEAIRGDSVKRAVVAETACEAAGLPVTETVQIEDPESGVQTQLAATPAYMELLGRTKYDYAGTGELRIDLPKGMSTKQFDDAKVAIDTVLGEGAVIVAKEL